MLNLLTKCASILSILGLFALQFTDTAEAQGSRYASEQRRGAAVGYYARARTMMVEALAEYEQGRKYARPDLLHDPEEFRLSVISLTEQLNRLVDPHARVTRDGVRFQANPRLIRRAKMRLPEVADGARDANDYGEKQRLKEIQSTRARMYEPRQREEEEDIQLEDVEQVEEENTLTERQLVDQVVEQAVAEARPVPSEQDENQINQNNSIQSEAEGVEDDDISIGTEAEDLAEGGKEPSEDERIASAIESAIQDRLNTLEEGLEEEGEE